MASELVHFFGLEHIKRSTQGKLAAATQVQSAEYLKPLFKALRSRVCVLYPLPSGQLTSLFPVVTPTRCARPYGRNSSFHAKSCLSTSQRLVPSAIHRKCPLAHRCHHGGVSSITSVLNKIYLLILIPSVFTNVLRAKKFLQIKWPMF